MYNKKFLMIPADKYARMEAQLKDLHSQSDVSSEQASKPETPPHDNHITADKGETERAHSPEPPSPSPADEASSLAPHFIIMSLPLKYRHKGQTLLNGVKHDIAWNEEGELLTSENVPVRGSHMAVLIRDWFHRYAKPIPGREEFFKLVQNCDLPPGMRASAAASGDKPAKKVKPLKQGRGGQQAGSTKNMTSHPRVQEPKDYGQGTSATSSKDTGQQMRKSEKTGTSLRDRLLSF